MTPIYASMRAEVESRGGIISKFVGDGVMAVFGVPDVREDDALRALDAAVGMRHAIDELTAEVQTRFGVRVAMKVGVNTGEIVFAEGDEDYVGDCVNVASRLEGSAAPGEVLVGEETWRLTRSDAIYESIAPLVLKGKSEPVPAYRLVSIERAVETGAARFVGRAGEMATLLQVFEDAIAAKASRLVTLIGSPGVGKTRLTREMHTVLAERATIIESRCDPAGSNAFAPIAETLRFVTGLADDADHATVEAAMRTLVDEHDPDADRIVRRAASLLGAGEPGSPEETFWAIRRIVERAALVLPLVLIFEDMQWAEPLLFDLIEHLAEWNRSAPVLIVATGRPELRDLHPSLVEGGRAKAVISLEGLDRSSTVELACGLLGTEDVPQDLLGKLPASTDGNPLFVREFVRMLIDDGVLTRAGAAWVSTVDVDSIDVPPTIQSLLSARVDRLSLPERTVLELASVIGKEFYRGAVEDLAPRTMSRTVDPQLEALRRKELVDPTGTYWIDEPVFRFHHALIRDAAYRRLLKELRAELHERVAEWLRKKTAGMLGEHAEIVGYHLEQAYESRKQLGPLDDHARSLAVRASDLLASAARTALDRDDLAAASGLAARAVALVEHDRDAVADVLLIRCEALLAMGDVTTAAATIADLDVCATTPRLKAWTTCFSSELANLTDSSQLERSAERLATAAAELAALGDASGEAKAHTVHAGVLARLGRVAESETALDRALGAARVVGDRRRLTAVLGAAPLAALWGPSPVSRAGGRCLDVVRLLRITTGSVAVELTSLRCQAVLEALRGRTDAARRMLRTARHGLEEIGLRRDLLETEQFAGIVEIIAGDLTSAAAHLGISHGGFEAMGIDVDAARSAALLAEVQLGLGKLDEADTLSQESERLAGDDLKAAIAWRGVRSQIASRRGDAVEALRLAREAVDIASRTDALFDHGTARSALANALRIAGDEDGASREAAEAQRLFTLKGATAMLSQAADASAQKPIPVPGPGEVTNRALECLRSSLQAAARLDVDAYRAGTSELITIEDRRRLFAGPPLVGIDAAVELTMAIAEIGTVEMDAVGVATRGDRLVLARTSFRGPTIGTGAFGDEVLGVYEIDTEGRIFRTVIFDTDDLMRALAELDGRYEAIGIAKQNRCMRAVRGVIDAFGSLDWPRIERSYSPDVVWIDERPGLQSQQIGRTDLLSNLHALADVGARWAELHPIAERGEKLALFRSIVSSDGEFSFQAETLTLVEIDDEGLVTATIVYDPADLDAAMRELNTRADVPHENAASRLARHMVDLVCREDWDAWLKCVSPDVEFRDRRPGFRAVDRGPDVLLASAKGLAAIGADANTIETIATRGDRCALSLHTFHNSDPAATFETQVLSTRMIDEIGRLRLLSYFDTGDMATALADLDELHRDEEAFRS